MKFTDVLAKHRIAYRISHGNSAEIKICCPFCMERRGAADSIFCLSINVVNGAGHCFHRACNWSSKNHAITAILRWLKEPHPVSSSQTQEDAPTLEPVTLPRDFHVLTRAYDDLDRRAQNYLLHKRKITHNQIQERKIGVCYLGRYAYRIIFPVYVKKKELHGIVARDFVGREPRYLNSPGIKSFYNLPSNLAEITTLVLSEGVFKALRIEQIIKTEKAASIAVLGSSMTEEQLEQLRQYPSLEEVVIFPDVDGVGRKGAIKIADALVQCGLKVSIPWPVAAPADEMPLEEIYRCLQERQIYGFHLRNQLRLGTGE